MLFKKSIHLAFLNKQARQVSAASEIWKLLQHRHRWKKTSIAAIEFKSLRIVLFLAYYLIPLNYHRVLNRSAGVIVQQ